MNHKIGYSKILFICLSAFTWNIAATTTFAQEIASEKGSVSALVEADSIDTDSIDAVLTDAVLTDAALIGRSLDSSLQNDSETAIEDISEIERASETDTSLSEATELAASQETPEIENSETAASETAASEIALDIAPEIAPIIGASALGEFKSVSSNTIAFEAAKRDLSAVASTFSVEESRFNESTLLALLDALENGDTMDRLYAADELWALTGDRALILPTLTAATASDDPQVRDLAIAALSQLSAQALPSGLPTLNDLLSNENTRQIAQDALTVATSENRSASLLQIAFREGRRRLWPNAIRAITDLF